MKKKVTGLAKALCLPLAVFMLFTVLNFQRFATWKTISTILVQSIIPTIVSYSMCFGFFCGAIDFSVGSRVILCCIIGSSLSQYLGFAGLVIGCMGTSVLLSAINGLVNKYTRIPTMVVAMGLTMMYEVVGQWLSRSSPYIRIDRAYTFLADFPYMEIVLILAAALFWFILNRTKFSYHTRAVGGNEAVARSMGIDPENTKLKTFLVGAIFLGIAAIMQISRSGVIDSAISMSSVSYMFQPLMGIQIGLALSAFCGLMEGIFIGNVTINLLFLGLVSMGLSDTLQDVALGVLLLAIMLYSVNKSRITYWLAKLKRTAVRSVA